jgi:hypothetical protein
MNIEEVKNDNLLTGGGDATETVKTPEQVANEQANETVEETPKKTETNEELSPVAPVKERINAYSVVIPMESWGILRGDLEKFGLPEDTTPTQYIGYLIGNREKITAQSVPTSAPPPVEKEPAKAQESAPPHAFVPPVQPTWVKQAIAIGAVVLIAVLLWIVFKYGKKSGAKNSIAAASAAVANGVAAVPTAASALFDVIK